MQWMNICEKENSFVATCEEISGVQLSFGRLLRLTRYGSVISIFEVN